MASEHDQQKEPQGVVNAPEQVADPSRRRFARAGVVAAPVIMTLASRPALGYYNCSLSGVLSGNLSNPNQNYVCAGKTPGFWGGGNFFGKPGQSAVKPSSRYGSAYGKKNWPAPIVPTTPFHSIFPQCTNLYGNHTFIEVICMNGTEDPFQLGQHAAAAYLNTLCAEQGLFGFTMDNWGMTRTQLLDLWSNNCAGVQSRLDLKTLLQQWNSEDGSHYT